MGIQPFLSIYTVFHHMRLHTLQTLHPFLIIELFKVSTFININILLTYLYLFKFSPQYIQNLLSAEIFLPQLGQNNSVFAPA